MIKLRDEKGLTLVSLIVTIIVIFILAVVNFTIIFGDEGIIVRAKDAENKSKAAEEQELIEHTWINLYQTQSLITLDNLITELKKIDEEWEKESNYIKSPNANKFTVTEEGTAEIIE